MTFISPLTEDEKRRRRRASGDVLEDGEYAGFDVAFRDQASVSSVFLTDSATDALASQKAVRDAAYAEQYHLPERASLNGDQAPLRQASQSAPASSDAAVRDAIRAAQFGG